jgi:hypothetical protein
MNKSDENDYYVVDECNMDKCANCGTNGDEKNNLIISFRCHEGCNLKVEPYQFDDDDKYEPGFETGDLPICVQCFETFRSCPDCGEKICAICYKDLPKCLVCKKVILEAKFNDIEYYCELLYNKKCKKCQ